MSLYRVLFDHHQPWWSHYGLIVFVENPDDAERAAQAEAPDGARVEVVEVRASSEDERARYQAKVRAWEQWLENNAKGKANRGFRL